MLLLIPSADINPSPAKIISFWIAENKKQDYSDIFFVFNSLFIACFTLL